MMKYMVSFDEKDKKYLSNQEKVFEDRENLLKR